MANVVHPPIDFHPGLVNHAPSPVGFGFGFGLSSTSTWTQGHTHPLAFHQLASTMSQQPSPLRVQKRRHEPDDEGENSARLIRDDAMDRSPTPERPKRAAPKRARVAPSVESGPKDQRTAKENKAPGSDGNDVDVGVLLASLPPQSLLPLLTSLLNAQPALKTTILPLIPRPTLETATQTLALSAKKLRDAYPYSNSPSSHVGSSYGFGAGSSLGFGSSSNRSSPHSFSGGGSSMMGFGKPASQSMFAQINQSSAPPVLNGSTNGGMRDTYILSRLRPHIAEFVSACMSYLPYFSYIPTSSSPASQPSASSSSPHATAIQLLHKDKSHPSETYAFLSALTTHLLSQPPLTQSALAPLLFPRLADEWRAWVDRVNAVVNREGGMFGSETVRGWERGLDEFAEAKGNGVEVLREVRDRWVETVGWLVGRTTQQPMEEEL